MKKILLFISIFLVQVVLCQKIDSLKNLIRPNCSDSERTKLLIKIGQSFYFDKGELDSSLYYLNKAKEVSRKAGLLKHYTNSLIVNANVIREKGEFEKATEDYFEALKIAEQIKDLEMIGRVYSGLAVIYNVKNDTKTAREYYNKAASIFTKLNRNDKLGSLNNNIGLSYMADKNMNMALKYFLKSLSIEKQNKNDIGIATAAENIGLVYDEFKDFDLAINYYTQAFNIWRSRNDAYSTSINMGYIAYTLNNKKAFKAAVDTALKALALAKKAGALSTQRDLHFYLHQSYVGLKDFESALFHFKRNTVLNDSLKSEEKIKAFTKSEMNYTFYKQQYKDSVEHVIEFKKKEAELKAEKNIRNLSLFSTIVFIGLLFFLFKSYREKKAANKLIIQQKELVEDKQKEIIDSITYAKRIQTALLASNKLLSENLREYFVFYRPKDIVAGDFYWATKVENKFIYVTGDCTGHGVPGAFMSLLNTSILSEVINEKKITRPDLILNMVRNEIISALNPEGSTEECKDGMDCVVIVLDREKNILEYAAANNSFYLIRNGQLIIYRPDKMPVSKSHDDQVPYKYHSIQLEKNDVIYTFTDGIADQFGGPNGKKFKYKQLMELLLRIQDLPLNDQQTQISQTIDDWKGHLSQVDDMCVIGVKI